MTDQIGQSPALSKVLGCNFVYRIESWSDLIVVQLFTSVLPSLRALPSLNQPNLTWSSKSAFFVLQWEAIILIELASDKLLFTIKYLQNFGKENEARGKTFIHLLKVYSAYVWYRYDDDFMIV